MLPLLVLLAASPPVAPLLDAGTVAVARIDLKAMPPDAIAREAGRFVRVQPDATLARLDELPGQLAALKAAGADELFVVAGLNDYPPGIFLAVPGDVPAAQAEALRAVGGFDKTARHGGFTVTGPPATLARLPKLVPAPFPDLPADGPVRVAVRLPDDLRRSLAEVRPDFAPALVQGVIDATATVADTDGRIALRATLRFRTGEAAHAGHLTLAVPLQLFKPLFVQQGETLSLSADTAAFGPVDPATVARWAAAVRAQRQLKALALAVHSYADANNQHLPHDITDKAGKPLLSWRVHMLPYLGDEYVELYKAIRQDEPWDSPHNKALLPRMPVAFAGPATPAAGGRRGSSAPRSPTGCSRRAAPRSGSRKTSRTACRTRSCWSKCCRPTRSSGRGRPTGRPTPPTRRRR